MSRKLSYLSQVTGLAEIELDLDFRLYTFLLMCTQYCILVAIRIVELGKEEMGGIIGQSQRQMSFSARDGA